MRSTSKSLTLILAILTLTLSGCIQEVVQPDTEYRGEIVLGEVLQINPPQLAATPLEMERVIPTDSIVVQPSQDYDGLEPATLDTVQVVLRYKEGITYWMDEATTIE